MFKTNFRREEVVLSMSLNIRRYTTQSVYLRLLVVITEIIVQAVQADTST